MAKKPVTEQDFENMSDEDFLKLDESEFSGNMAEGETDFSEAKAPEGDAHAQETPDADEDVDGDDGSNAAESDGSQPDPDTDGSASKDEANVDGQQDPMAGEGKPASEAGESTDNQQPTPDSQEEGKTGSEAGEGGVGDVSGDGEVKPKAEAKAETPAKAGYYKLPEGMDSAGLDAAVDFYKKLSVPFKADGKDFTVRSPEDAIRLMQQGVNYSRRMHELKPMKAMNRMLQDNGLADQNKLNFAIDLMKGNKEAIAKLLKSHNIDPMDLDTEKDSGYQATNYGGNAQDNAFRDALDEAIAIPEGQALVNDIHANWDVQSKAKLRENPSILGNLTQMKMSGVYDKVVAELDYQQAQGYLVGVPFLQAFDQVGEAMKNAGVFDEAKTPAANGNPMAPLASQPQGQPVASGARKQNQAPKKPAANPHLSSTPPSKQSGNTTPTQPDFSKMSDEEFLKMAPPE
ncbi:tail length tape measure protein [Dinoroseobacter phage DS-1410Ws-06]|uniref:Tape measure protein n=1 Tax=Dinoroseobacter phage DS-1410Ws-06 TaxID=1815983 RepID=A0A191VYD1_9CAUD|nr:tail length tape measure protein [Dinoroseobacter phage DS-1410Ws-06]ANJ20721.1 hypothetical protein DSp06_gp64 [Dinoroseobacter phage DS-1410Ws-06]